MFLARKIGQLELSFGRSGRKSVPSEVVELLPLHVWSTSLLLRFLSMASSAQFKRRSACDRIFSWSDEMLSFGSRNTSMTSSSSLSESSTSSIGSSDTPFIIRKRFISSCNRCVCSRKISFSLLTKSTSCRNDSHSACSSILLLWVALLNTFLFWRAVRCRIEAACSFASWSFVAILANLIPPRSAPRPWLNSFSAWRLVKFMIRARKIVFSSCRAMICSGVIELASFRWISDVVILLTIDRARSAYRNVFNDSSMCISAGDTHAMKIVRQWLLLHPPPNELRNILVSLLSRYGTCTFCSCNDDMTFPNTNKSVLIWIDSFRFKPVTPLSLIRSDPAKSTNVHVIDVVFAGASGFIGCVEVDVTVNT